MSGYNPIRWRCETDGCFNVKKRPKIEQFHECFPGRVNFGDVDGIVELSGMALLLEWKPAPKELSVGQRIMYQNLSKHGVITALVLAGDAETMRVSHRRYFWKGNQSSWAPSSMDDAKDFCARWAKWALGIGQWAKDYDKACQQYDPSAYLDSGGSNA